MKTIIGTMRSLRYCVFSGLLPILASSSEQTASGTPCPEPCPEPLSCSGPPSQEGLVHVQCRGGLCRHPSGPAPSICFKGLPMAIHKVLVSRGEATSRARALLPPHTAGGCGSRAFLRNSLWQAFFHLPHSRSKTEPVFCTT